MVEFDKVADYLEQFAPLRLAAEWDNVGLLVGDRAAPVQRLMTCLTVTPASAQEAVERGADLIVTHHPLPFRATKSITSDTTAGQMLLQLIAAGIRVYSPHTAFDSTAQGINQQLACTLELVDIEPLQTIEGESVGIGRFGKLPQPTTLADVANRFKQHLGIEQVRGVGNHQSKVSRVGIACGSAGEFLDAAKNRGCDLFVTGETSFHTCLAAEAQHVAMLLLGHFASERFAVEKLAQVLQDAFPKIDTWTCEAETDPLQVF